MIDFQGGCIKPHWFNTHLFVAMAMPSGGCTKAIFGCIEAILDYIEAILGYIEAI